jgi:hypothetical protein
MSSVDPSRFTGPLIALLIFGWIAYRRTRPQPVGIARTVLFTAFIVLSSLAGLAANPGTLRVPLFIGLAPIMLLVGLGLGWTMMRQIHFWRDQATGKVWMAGGAAYVAIWLATLALRLGIDYAAGSFSGAAARATDHPTTLAILASDLLFLSVGLWLMRGVILVRRVREHTLLAGGGSREWGGGRQSAERTGPWSWSVVRGP